MRQSMCLIVAALAVGALFAPTAQAQNITVNDSDCKTGTCPAKQPTGTAVSYPNAASYSNSNTYWESYSPPNTVLSGTPTACKNSTTCGSGVIVSGGYYSGPNNFVSASPCSSAAPPVSSCGGTVSTKCGGGKWFRRCR